MRSLKLLHEGSKRLSYDQLHACLEKRVSNAHVNAELKPSGFYPCDFAAEANLIEPTWSQLVLQNMGVIWGMYEHACMTAESS